MRNLTVSRKTLTDRLGLRADASQSEIQAALAAPNTGAPAGSLRTEITDRLGLPQNATNEQIFAAIDAVVVANAAKAAEDELMRKAGW